MLHFNNLSILFKHLHFTHKTLNVSDVFFVWWAVRDVLLGITDDPMDIDCTLAGDPSDIWDEMQFDETLASRFRTEKFGTMTLLPKRATPKTLEPIATKPDETDVPSPAYEYEITPFRTEWGYTDVRHPDEIQRSNNLIADSRRRDLTINCLYRYGVSYTDDKLSHPLLVWPTCKIPETQTFQQALWSKLPLYIPWPTPTLIVQDHKQIDALFLDGVFQNEYFYGLYEQSHYRLNDIVVEEDEDNKENDHITEDDSPYIDISIIVDPHGWLLDLLRGKIQTVGTPDDRFTEDALRIIRAVRFANILNQKKLSPPVKGVELGKASEGGLNETSFDFDKKTRIAMQTHAPLVSQLSGERIHDELKKVFSANNPFGYVSLLHELWLLPIIFPAIAATIGNEQPTRHHSLDTFHHTLMALKEWQQLFSNINSTKQSDVPPVKGVELGKASEGGLENSHYLPLIAILYHDVGKPEQYQKMWEAIAANPDNPDRSTYEYHTESWALLAQQDLQKLCFSKKEIEEVMWYIRRHHRPGEILDGKPEKQPVRMRKLMSDGWYLWTKNLLHIVIADRLWQHNPLQLPQLDEIHQLDALLDQLYKDEWRFTLAQMELSGKDLIDELWLTPGPELWALLSKAFDRVIWDVPTRNEREKILGYVQSL